MIVITPQKMSFKKGHVATLAENLGGQWDWGCAQGRYWLEAKTLKMSENLTAVLPFVQTLESAGGTLSFQMEVKGREIRVCFPEDFDPLVSQGGWVGPRPSFEDYGRNCDQFEADELKFAETFLLDVLAGKYD